MELVEPHLAAPLLFVDLIDLASSFDGFFDASEKTSLFFGQYFYK